jgi:predicted Zn-dependent peptidase
VSLSHDYVHGTTTLENGLTVVTVEMPHLHTASVAVYVRCGARHEDATTNGLSHFLEHMFFRGADGFVDSTALNAAMEDLGGYLDGFTTRDHSGYQSTVHPQFVGEATEILASMFRAPRFLDIDVERSIILEEVLDALDERGREIDLDTISHQEAFPEHALGQSIDGPRKNLKRFSRADLQAHRRRFYGARNMVVCFSGRIDPEACRAHAARSFGALPKGRRVREGEAPALPPSAPSARFVHFDDAQTRARLSFRTVSDQHPDYPALLLLRRVVDGGLSARLQVELVEKRGIVYEIGADLETYADCGLFDFELAVAHKKLAYAFRELGKVILDLVRHGVGQEELDRVRRRARFGLELGLDSTTELSHWFGVTRLFHEPISPEERMAQLDRVTPADLARVLGAYFRPERMTFAAVGGADREVIKATRAELDHLAQQLSGEAAPRAAPKRRRAPAERRGARAAARRAAR